MRTLREKNEPRSRIRERTISLRFLGIIVKFLRLEVSQFNVFITNQLHYTTFAQGGGGEGGKPLVEVNLKTFV